MLNFTFQLYQIPIIRLSRLYRVDQHETIGLEILVHIGIDTINLKGQGFKKYVKEGQRVSLGDKVISVNNYQLKNNGIDLTTMMLFPNNKFPLKFVCKGKVKKAKTIVAMYEVKEKRG